MKIETCKPDPLPPKNLEWDALISLIGEAREALGRYDEALKKTSLKKLQILKWEEAIASLRALDLNTTLDEVLNYSKNRSKKKSSPVLEKVLNAKKGLDFAISWSQKKPLNLSFYCKVHAIVKKDAPYKREVGRIRKRQNWIGSQGCKIEEAYFYPPESKDLKKYLRLMNEYARKKDKDPIVQTAIVFAQFLIIHPFMDGNGRVARIFIPAYLYKKGLLSRPYLFMSRYFATHRLAYFQKLFHISEKKAWQEWISYFLQGIKEQADLLRNCLKIN